VPELFTDRLHLRPWSEADLGPWAGLCSDPNFWRFPFGRGIDQSESEELFNSFLRHWEEHGFGLWAATLASNGKLIGFIGLAIPTFLPEILPAVEVGWRLGTEWWGKGLATEGGRASLAYAFEKLNLERIVSIVEPQNESSIRVAERLGMTLERKTVHPTLRMPIRVLELQRDHWTTSSA
jgi:RimJ/RimL family protein N-acetyltransferase